MKRVIVIFASAVLTTFLGAQDAVAFPGERVFAKTTHFAHKAAYKINEHVVQPARRVVVRHTSS
jgi:hypothetical protein